ncbi:MAG: gamma-glutamyltransferase family protein, partial [Saprospiraceae bacterium]|nr:gamma-glutamyltransferase family protein [Saprospiraceae bacterium]
RKLNKHLDDFKLWNTLNIPFIKDHWKVGDVLKQRSLASTLEKIANHGKDYFYASDLSDSLVTHIQDLGGIISKTDLESYTSVWREPLSKSYKGFDVHSMPLPSSGGIVLSQILETLDNYDLTSPLHPKDIHLMVEAERRAYADRAAYLGDPAYIKVPIDKLLDPVYIDERMSSFSWQRATDSDSVYTGDFSIEKEGFETTHLSVVDKDGNAVALTTTLNSNYGSKIFFPYGGFFLNNEMDDFSVKPGIPNQFGLIGNEANAIEAGKRMLSSMTPTIVEKDGEFFMALGTPGGSTIITSVLQVFLNVVEYDLSLEESIALPRFHHQWLPDIIFYEPALPDSIRMHLKQMGHLFKEKDYIGFVDAVMRMPDGRLIGGADPRGDDHTSGY